AHAEGGPAMGFAWRVAVRFLLEGRMQTLLLVVGVAAGVAVVTYITALIDGLQANTIRRTLGVQPHLTIRPVKDVPLAGRLAVPRADASAPAPDVSSREQPRAQRTRSIDNWTPLARDLERTPGVVAVSPMAGGTAIALRGEGSRAVAIVGIELERYDRIAALSDKLVEGVPRLGPGEAIVGRELAEDLGVRLGDRFSLSLGRDTVESLRAVAIFDVGVRDVNRRNVYVPLRTAQSLLGIPGGATQLDLTVTEVFEAEDVARRLRARLPYEIESWMQTNSQLLSALDAQTMSTRLIRGVVMIVVVLGIASVLVVSVVQKRKEIGILRAMGASRAQMTRVFLLQGALVSAAGSVLGAALAWVMVVAFTALVKGADGQPLFPIVLRLDTFAWVALGATIAGVLAAVAPARRAAALDPAQAIRL
ncbi:MAG: ABC transporter permease, partial [Burkholderiales bacterium]